MASEYMLGVSLPLSHFRGVELICMGFVVALVDYIETFPMQFDPFLYVFCGMLEHVRCTTCN